MKRILIVCGVLAAVIIALAVAILLNLRSQRPDVLVSRLLAADLEDANTIAMKLNMARGDVAGAMIEGFARAGVPSERKAMLLELMFKKQYRAADPDLEDAIRAVADSPDPVLRRKLAYCVAVYQVLDDLAVTLARDADRPTSREAMEYLCTTRAWRLWDDIGEPNRAELVVFAQGRLAGESDPQTRLMLRSIIGREIAIRCDEGMQAFQASDLVKADKLLRGALALDPNNQQAQIRLVRYELQTIDPNKALADARKFGALIEIPELAHVPAIDGDPQEPNWAGAYHAKNFYITTSPWVARPVKGRTEALLGHKDGRLYLAMIGYEQELSRLVRERTARDSEVYRDDCMEFIFDPAISGNERFQIIINTRDAVMDQRNSDTSFNFEFQHKTMVFQDRGYWACEIAMDGNALGKFRVAPGEVWAMDLFRGRIGPASEHCAMWPTFGGALKNHMYPLVTFVGPRRPEE